MIDASAVNSSQSDWVDPATQWHSGHIGNGKIGKWKDKLEPGLARAFADAFTPFQMNDDLTEGGVVWRPELFHYAGEPASDGGAVLFGSDENPCRAYGPYLYLPVGRWRVDFLLEAIVPHGSWSATLDIFTTGGRWDVISMRREIVKADRREPVSLEFCHDDHRTPIEARVHLSAGSAGSEGIRFYGAKVTLLDDLPARGSIQNYPV